MKINIYSDGGSRGNPGEAAIGAVIEIINGKKPRKISPSSDGGKYTYSQKIGKTTNNEAEYQAIIFALQKAKQLVSKKRAKTSKVFVYSDSELVVSQLSGSYKIEDDNLAKLFVEAHNLTLDFKEVAFKLISREENKEADHLVKAALNAPQLLF